MESLHFPRTVSSFSSFGPFLLAISFVFCRATSREAITPLKKQKDFFNRFPNSSVDFG
jgi:hypothetical protein